MLILGRKTGDTVVIDGGITVTVLVCEKGGVRLGFTAPDDVTILRGEIVRQVADQNRRAAAAPADVARALAALLPAPAVASAAAPAPRAA